MSNSVAYPVARTDRKDEAYQIAQRLMGLVDGAGGEVDLKAITDTHVGVPGYMAALPSAVFTIEVPGTLAQRVRDLLTPHLADPDDVVPWFDGGLRVHTRADQAPVATLLQLPPMPVEVRMFDEPIEGTDPARWVQIVGADRARIVWSLDGGWPALPDLDLYAQRKHCMVQLNLNSRDIGELHPAVDHTVYVHVGSRDEEERRAEWLARQIGSIVIDSPEWGW